MPEFELVLPCYNESRSLRAIVERAAQAARAAGYGPDRFKLVLVENGSQDDSARVLEELARTELAAWFRVVAIAQNQGYGHGVVSGLQSTTAPFIAWSHADQQCDPKDAFTALERLRAARAPTLVKGVRAGRNWKDVAVSRVFDFFAHALLGSRFYEINAQPKVFRRELLAELKNPPTSFAFDLYALYRAKKLGYSIEEIPVDFPPRAHGASRWAATFLGRYKTILGMISYMRRLARTEGRL